MSVKNVESEHLKICHKIYHATFCRKCYLTIGRHEMLLRRRMFGCISLNKSAAAHLTKTTQQSTYIDDFQSLNNSVRYVKHTSVTITF